MKILFLISFLFLVTIYFNRKTRDGFITPQESLTEANKFMLSQLKYTNETEKKEKILNAINYIKFIKTLF